MFVNSRHYVAPTRVFELFLPVELGNKAAYHWPNTYRQMKLIYTIYVDE